MSVDVNDASACLVHAELWRVCCEYWIRATSMSACRMMPRLKTGELRTDTLYEQRQLLASAHMLSWVMFH